MKKKQKRIGKPSWLLYSLYIYISALIFRIRGVRLNIDRSGLADLKGPALILCPHISVKDHIIVGLALMPHRPTFVLSEHFMTRPAIRPFLVRFGRVITKKMFCPDAGTILNIMRAKKEGNIILLFPEGRLGSAFHSLPVTPGTAELVKRLGVSVYSVTGNGAALAFPKWGEKYRRGKISVTTNKLLSSEDILNMPTDEISDLLDKAMYHNDEKAMDGEKYLCKNTAEGLDGIFYMCPECESEFTLETKRNRIKCLFCGFETSLTNNYRFTAGRMKTINQWFDFQLEKLSPDTVLEDEVKIGAADKNGNMNLEAGFGKVRMDKDSFTLDGEVYGEKITLKRETGKIGGTPYTPMKEFDIYYDKRLLYLMPNDRRKIMKYVNLVDKASQGGFGKTNSNAASEKIN